MKQQITQSEPSDYPQGYYHVRVDYAVGHKPAVVDVERLAGLLPHGSGIDGDWHIWVFANGDVRCSGEYHAMNDGDYTRWHSFHFTLRHAIRNEYQPLHGPCEGQYQVIKIKGHVYFTGFRGGGGIYYGDYLYDTCYRALEALKVPAIESGITVYSEQEAKEYI